MKEDTKFNIGCGIAILIALIVFMTFVTYVTGSVQRELDENRAQLIRDARNCKPL